MRTLRLVAAGLFVVGLVVGGRAEEKKDSNKQKIVGTWERSGSDGDKKFNAVFVFAKDGTLKVTLKKDGKEERADGSYSVDGDKVSLTVKKGDKEDKNTWTIKKLTETDMVIFDEARAMMLEFKRKK